MSNRRKATPLPLSELHHFELSAGSEKPLYLQLCDAFREAIVTGKLGPGFKLPASRKLAADLGVSRNTVANAYEELRRQGFLESRIGSGCFVSQELPDNSPINPADRTGLPVDDGILRQQLSAMGKHHLHQHERSPETLPRAFAPGLPDLGLLPLELWARLAAKQWRRATPGMLAYADSAGYPPLREAIAEYLNACRGVRCAADQVLITSGSQQALDLTARLLLDKGDKAWVEDPCYQGALGALNGAGADCISVPIDREGLRVAEGQRLCPKPKLIFATPSHQYPLGTTMSTGRRLMLLHFVQRSAAWLIEDDYDSEFQYENRTPAAIQGMDESGRVIYIGTFSRVLFPALRIGYLVVPQPLRDVFFRARSYADSFMPPITQAVLATFIREGHFAAHLRRMRTCYGERRKVMKQLTATYLNPHFQAKTTMAGMHLTLSAQQPFNDVRFSELCGRQGIEVRPLSIYYRRPGEQAGLVLGFAGFDSETQERNMAKLAEIFKTNDLTPANRT